MEMVTRTVEGRAVRAPGWPQVPVWAPGGMSVPIPRVCQGP